MRRPIALVLVAVLLAWAIAASIAFRQASRERDRVEHRRREATKLVNRLCERVQDQFDAIERGLTDPHPVRRDLRFLLADTAREQAFLLEALAQFCLPPDLEGRPQLDMTTVHLADLESPEALHTASQQLVAWAGWYKNALARRARD